MRCLYIVINKSISLFAPFVITFLFDLNEPNEVKCWVIKNRYVTSCIKQRQRIMREDINYNYIIVGENGTR